MIPPSAKHYETILHTLDKLQPGRSSEFSQPLHKVSESLRRRGILVLISDLYETPERIVEAVNELRYRGNDMIVFHILDPAEVDLSVTDVTSFEDLETGERLPVVPDQFRNRYQALVQQHIDALHKQFGQNRIDYAFFVTSQPLDHALFRYLSDRQRLIQVR